MMGGKLNFVGYLAEILFILFAPHLENPHFMGRNGARQYLGVRRLHHLRMVKKYDI